MTLAAKHFDPVVGVDIHLIQPPGPVPPVPIPHPFVGFLIDPADYVPIVGSTVMINGLHRAQAGTAGKCVPPHIPIGGVFVPPLPGNECEMFMGSATVCVDGDAQSFMSLPALSCQSFGMPSIPRANPKKKTIPKCLMLPTSSVIAIPAGPPVLIGGPPTIFTMALGMKALMAGLGKLAKGMRRLQKSSKRWKAVSNKLHDAAKKGMNKLGVPPSVQNKVHRAICSVTGHPVDIATGKVFTDAVDFSLSGPLPLQWERVYFSTSVYNGPLGYGWHHSYDLGLVDEGDAVVVRMQDGRAVVFPPIGIGGSAYNRSERMTLLREFDGYRMRTTDGMLHQFGVVAFDTPVQKLLQVTDRAGCTIEFLYDRHGLLSEIIDSCGRHLPVVSDSRGRITQISGPHPEKPNETTILVSYEYDHAGRLLAVLDALNQPMTFDYNASGQLIRETDRVGLSFAFEYDGPGSTARCIRTWGDNGIYDHRLEYDADLKRTIVTNSLGQRTLHYWNDDGLVVRAVDPLRNAIQTVYNEYRQPTAVVNELGQQTAYEYDPRGNQTALVAPDGATLQVTWNDHDLPMQAVNSLGHQWNWEYDEQSRLTARTDPSGRQTKFLYDGRRLSAVVNPAGDESKIEYDGAGNLHSVTTPDGVQSFWEYDRLGRPVKVTTPAGVQQRTFDLLGRITRVSEPDGNLRTLTYDAAGNILHAKDLQHDIRFTYQGMGRLATRREAGTTVEFRYNTEEDLIGIVNEHGLVYRFELDENGNVAREYGFDDIRRVYTRDDAGQVIRVERASGLISWYDYDPAGRVIAVRHSDDTQESYVYREDGELIEASNSSCTVRFELDEAGRILREWQGDYWVSSTYDSNGRRREMRSCFGALQQIERNAMGDVVEMQYVDTQQSAERIAWEAKIRRDGLGFELQRSLPGGIQSRWERDRLGRPLRHEIQGVAGGGHDIQYKWDVNHRLRQVVDAQNGTTTYEYDDPGNLAAASYDDGSVEFRMPDAVGNLFHKKDRRDRRYGRAGQLLESRDETGITTYEYDAEGNLIRKRTPDGQWLYAWNAVGMLQSVTRPDGEEVIFEYDALGRRISKTFRGRKTRWIWDGNNPLHEWVEVSESTPNSDPVLLSVSAAAPPPEAGLVENPATGPPEDAEKDILPAPAGVITWLFDPESFAPAAKLVDGQQYSIVTDYLGTPCAMLDASGLLVWSASMSVYGEVRSLLGDRHACPFRWPGQYEDAETGLYYNRFRYYAPDVGQYISQDPIQLAGGLRSYGYVDDPNKSIDPFGLTKCDGGNAPSTKPKPYSNPSNRPKYGKGQVDEVWENAKQADGKVYDPNTGAELTWDPTKPRTRQWNMGHKPGKKYSDLHKDYMDGKITKEEFLREYRDPNNYWPEDWLENQSHKWE